MGEFKRGLSNECVAELRRWATHADGNWWKDVLARSDILLAVRGGTVNAYVKGQSIFKIGGRESALPIKIHYKYLIASSLEGNPYVSFNGEKFDLDPGKVVYTNYKPGETLSQLVANAARFAGAEKIGVDRIAAKEPKVVDVEVAFTRDGDQSTRSSAPRMDLAVLVPLDTGVRLIFCEAKFANNVELWKPAEGSNSEPSVVEQIGGYEKFIGAHASGLESAYVSVCQTLVELYQQGYKRHSQIDPLVVKVAAGEIRPVVHPHVYLLVYDYDGDQKGGAVEKRLRVLRQLLAERVIAKGNAGSFRLADDICRQEKRSRT
jgi:hypothetical protein